MIKGDALDAWMRQIEMTLLRLDAQGPGLGRIAQPSPIARLVEEGIRLRVAGGGAGHRLAALHGLYRIDDARWGYAPRSEAGGPPPGEPLLAPLGHARLLRNGHGYPTALPVDPLLRYQGLDPEGLERLRRAVHNAGRPWRRRALARLATPVVVVGIWGGAVLIARRRR